MRIYIVEVESGCSAHGDDAELFDSAWTTEESAKEYASKKFAQAGWVSQVPSYTITEVTLND